MSETTGFTEVSNGTITVTRIGSLEANSCKVTCIVPPEFEDESAPNGNTFLILEEDNLGVPECYIATSNSAVVASVNDPKGSTSLAFAEGVALGYVSVVLEVNEEGHDALDQYGFKDVTVDICGKPFTYRLHRMGSS